MHKFSFRLQRLLNYRVMHEKWTKDAFLAARARRLEVEDECSKIADMRESLLHSASNDLPARIALESTLERLDDAQRAQETVIGILSDEEGRARDHWLKAKQEAEAIDKLRESRLEEWQVEATRAEQNELDDWSSARGHAS